MATPNHDPSARRSHGSDQRMPSQLQPPYDDVTGLPAAVPARLGQTRSDRPSLRRARRFRNDAVLGLRWLS